MPTIADPGSKRSLNDSITVNSAGFDRTRSALFFPDPPLKAYASA